MAAPTICAQLSNLSITMLLVGLIGTGAAAGQPYQAFPVDEANRVPAVAELRDSLLDAVYQRDTDRVVSLAAPNIALSFGADWGSDTLRDWLEGTPDYPWTGETYWQQLQVALELGGAWWPSGISDRAEFCAPYTFYAPYPPAMDPFMVIMVMGKDVPLFRSADRESSIVARLDHAIAEVVETPQGFDPANPNDPYWVLARTADGVHEGYLLSDTFRSPVDYRACFGYDDQTQEWVWHTFIAGD